MTVISHMFFLFIKLAVAFYMIRNALRRNNRHMALGQAVMWLGIIMMSFPILEKPGLIIMLAGPLLILRAMKIDMDNTPTRQDFEKARREFIGMFGERINRGGFGETIRIKERKEPLTQDEADKKYNKRRWK